MKNQLPPHLATRWSKLLRSLGSLRIRLLGGGNWFILNWINRLLAATRLLSAGNLSARTGSGGAGELARLAGAFDEMATAIEQRHSEQRRAQDQIQRQLRQVITAQEDERMRIARELHGETGQSLSALILGLDVAQMVLAEDKQKTEEHLKDLKAMTEETLRDLRRLIADLRPSLLDDLGLGPALAWYGEQRLTPLGIRFVLNDDGQEERLPPEMETALFRIVQEGITNGIRHAHASAVDIDLIHQDGFVTLQLADNGCGFNTAAVESNDTEGRGLGLRGMQERANLLGGEFQLRSAPGAGTTIRVRVPVLSVEEKNA